MSAQALTQDVEQTVALVRQGNTLELYVDGALSCAATVDSWDDAPGVVSPDRLVLGAHAEYVTSGSTAAPFVGTIRGAYFDRGSTFPSPPPFPPSLQP